MYANTFRGSCVKCRLSRLTADVFPLIPIKHLGLTERQSTHHPFLKTATPLGLRSIWRCAPHQCICPSCQILKTWCASNLIRRHLVEDSQICMVGTRLLVGCSLRWIKTYLHWFPAPFLARPPALADPSAILSLYFRHSCQVQEGSQGSSLVDEHQGASSYLSSVIKEQVEAAGRALAFLWVVRCHLCLSPSSSKVIETASGSLAMFGPDATKLLQQAQESCRCAREVSGSLSRRYRGSRQVTTSVPQLRPEFPASGPGDLRSQLEAFHRHNNRQGKKGRPDAQAQKFSR